MTTTEIKQLEEKYQTYSLEQLYDELTQVSRQGEDFEGFYSSGWEEMGFESFEDYCVDFTIGYIESTIVNDLIKEREKEVS